MQNDFINIIEQCQNINNTTVVEHNFTDAVAETLYEKIVFFESEYFIENQPLNGDLIIGFKSTCDLELEIIITVDGNTKVFTQKLKKDIFDYPVCNIIPIVFSDINIKLTLPKDEKLYILGAILNCDYGKQLLQKIIKSYTLDNNFPILYYNNCNSSDKDIITFPLICKEQYKKQKSKDLSDLIEQELLEVSMNPDRLRWFLSIDQQKKYLK
uniref:Uncharacterized protein n=1 Tax=viral metagenome TaxID=1070528 RepID=A0A6C0E1N5_9ZZZZ